MLAVNLIYFMFFLTRVLYLAHAIHPQGTRVNRLREQFKGKVNSQDEIKHQNHELPIHKPSHKNQRLETHTVQFGMPLRK